MTRGRVIWIIGLGLALIVAAVILVAVSVPRALRKFLYPPAPPMPAVVSRPVTEILAELEMILKTNAPKVLEQLQPGLADEEIAKLERQAGLQLPDDIKALYRWHDG